MIRSWTLRIAAVVAGFLAAAAFAYAAPLHQPAVSVSVPPVICAAGSSGCALKTGPALFFSAYATAGSTGGFLMVFNTPTTPSNGSTTFGSAPGNLVDCIAISANSTGGVSYTPDQPEPIGGTSSGLYIVFSTGANCGTLTLNTTAYLHGSAE